VTKAPCPTLSNLGAELAASSAILQCSEGIGIFLAVLYYGSDKNSETAGAAEARRISEDNQAAEVPAPLFLRLLAGALGAGPCWLPSACPGRAMRECCLHEPHDSHP